MDPDRHGLARSIKSLIARWGASMDRWQIAKRGVYVALLGMSLLIFYLLWSLDEALDMLAH
jgi:hypothetical protein